MRNINLGRKSTPKKLFIQVKNILFTRGFSFAYNENDIQFFFLEFGENANVIAESIIQECCQPSDFADYEVL